MFICYNHIVQSSSFPAIRTLRCRPFELTIHLVWASWWGRSGWSAPHFRQKIPLSQRCHLAVHSGGPPGSGQSRVMQCQTWITVEALATEVTKFSSLLLYEEPPYFYGSMQEDVTPLLNALELRLSCINPSIWKMNIDGHNYDCI